MTTVVRASATERGEVQKVGPRDEEHRDRGGRDDDRRPEVGLTEDEPRDEAGDDEERDRASPERPGPGPGPGEPVGEEDDEGELRELGRVDGRQRSHLEPAGRATDDARLERAHRRQQDDDEEADGDDACRDADEPQVAVVDEAHRDHDPDAERRPEDLGADEGERVALAEIALDARRRVDHEDADSSERDDRDEDRVVGRVAIALETGRPPCDRRSPGRRRSGDIGRSHPDERPSGRGRSADHAPPPLDRSAAIAATACLKARPRAA